MSPRLQFSLRSDGGIGAPMPLTYMVPDGERDGGENSRHSGYMPSFDMRDLRHARHHTHGLWMLALPPTLSEHLLSYILARY